MQEYLTKNVEPKTVFGDWPVWHRYTYGVAGERFFREMKEHGRFVASTCPQCRRSFLPPIMYCEDCFVEMTEYRPVEGPGTVESFSVLHESLDETPLAEPILIAFVRFDGVTGGWLAPLAGVAPEEVHIGIRVKPIFKPKGEREGLLTDLAHFAPV